MLNTEHESSLYLLFYFAEIVAIVLSYVNDSWLRAVQHGDEDEGDY